MADDRWGVYISERNGKYFRVEHRYAATQIPDEPTTFDDVVTQTIGIAETKEEAERIMKEYETKLKIESEHREEEDEE